MNILKNKIWFLFIACFLTACIPTESKETKEFITRIESAYKTGTNEILLKDVVGFEFKEVCFFHPADSQPKSGYEAYQERLKGKNIPPLKEEPYNMIFLFSGNDGYIQFATTRHSLKINNQKYWVRLEDHDNVRTGGCLSGDVHMRKETSQYLAMYSKK